MIPIYRKNGQGMRICLRDWWYGRMSLLQCISNMFNFYMNREVKSTETNNVINTQESGNEHGRAVRS